MALARLSLLQSALLLNDSAATYAAEYKALLLQASRAVQTFTGRTLALTTYTDEPHAGDMTRKLYPRQWPVASVSSVGIWDGSSFVVETAANYEVIDSRYIMFPKAGKEGVASYAAWPPPPGVAWVRSDALAQPIGALLSIPENIKISYIAGYDDTGWDTKTIAQTFGVPEDLEYAVAQLAAYLWRRRGASGIVQEQFGPRSVQYHPRSATPTSGEGIPEEVRGSLEPYTRLELL